MIRVRAVLAAACLALAAACTSPDERIAGFADQWDRGEFAGAEASIDQLIASESGTDLAVVTSSHGLDESIDANEGDTFLFLLEKAMTRLAAGDLDSAIDLLRRSRDALAKRWDDTDVKGFLSAGLGDDTFRDYTGADYEHVVVPALLAVVDLLNGGQDAFAYALQVGEVQERILGSTFGENLDEEGHGYNPRKEYQRLAIGAYVEGLLREREGFGSEANKAYERARAWGGDTNPVIAEAVQRTGGGAFAAPHHGVVHVFRFAGRGPRLVQGSSPITDQALLLANVGSILIGESIGVIGQTMIPVPVVANPDSVIAPLEVRVDGQVAGSTATVLDVGAVAGQQLNANMPWILARAAIRRGVKAVAAKAAQDASSDDWGFLAGLATNLVLTAGENADTRNWTSLPSQLQVARFELPEGESTLDLGLGLLVPVRVAAGKDTYVLVIQPDLAHGGRAIVDVYSRVAAPAVPSPAPEATAPVP